MNHPDNSLGRFIKKPYHKWFSAPCRKLDAGWYGPHETVEAAVIECAKNQEENGQPIFVAQAYKLTRAERDEWGGEFSWQVDVQNAIEVRLPCKEK